MRWLYLCNDLGIPLDGTKGASEHVRAITRALCRCGEQVSVLAARGTLPAGHPARQYENPIGDEARRLGDGVRRWLAAQDGPAGLATELSQMICEARLLEAVERQAYAVGVDVVLERLSLFSSAGRELARRAGAAYLVEMNAPLAQEAAQYRESSLPSLAASVERRTLRSADVVLTVSNELRAYALAEHGLDPARVVTVSNGVELELFGAASDRAAARREARVPADALVFGFVGSLKVWHGIEVLLDAFSEVSAALPAAHLLLIGDGRRLEHYRGATRAMGLSRCVTFFGGTDHATVARLLSAVDVAVAPYLPQATFYFSPLKLYEYMAAGLCVIASREGQIAEVIEDGRNGLLVAAGDAAALAREMIRVGRDAELRARLGEAARKSVARCGWDDTARRVIELAREAAERLRKRADEVVHAAV